ncbi:MAG TPA: ATP-grasp domain-containing protein [Gaiellaceae bacterium]|nr:ATP-grasp domain-containing protein [Gaiellaceae bacterium]
MASSSGRKRLLVLGAGPAQLGLLEAARAQGMFTIVVDRDPGAIGFALASRRAIISTEDERGIERLVAAERVDGVIAPGIDWPVGIAARVAAKHGLPHPLEPSVAGLAVSKARQRERLDVARVPQPRWKLVSRPEAGLPVPAVVKAPDRQGQRGLSVVRDERELSAAIETALEASRNDSALVEELVEGPEVTVNAYSIHGRFYALTVTDRLTAEPPAFGVALAHVWPPEADVDGAAAALARRAVEALGIQQGPTYTQVRFGADGPRIMEVAARLGGGHDAELCEAALGVDLNALALAAALGEEVEPPVPERRVGGACTAFLVPSPGELVALEGEEEARRGEGIVFVRVYRRPGFRFGEFRTGSDRAGAVLATGASREEALERAKGGAALLRFETDAALV